MCLATVYLTHDGTDEQLCSSVSRMSARDDVLVFTDLFGKSTKVKGEIYEMEFSGSHIYVTGSVVPD